MRSRLMGLLFLLLTAPYLEVSFAQTVNESSATTANVDTPAKKLIGIWKSDSELTLTSLNEIEGISKDSLEYLKQNVFGLLTREFTATDTRVYFGKVKAGEAASQFAQYRILEASESQLRIKHTDPLTEKTVISTLHFTDEQERDCYYELVSKWQFKEYFCRDEGKKKKFIAIPKGNQRKQ